MHSQTDLMGLHFAHPLIRHLNAIMASDLAVDTRLVRYLNYKRQDLAVPILPARWMRGLQHFTKEHVRHALAVEADDGAFDAANKTCEAKTSDGNRLDG